MSRISHNKPFPDPENNNAVFADQAIDRLRHLCERIQTSDKTVIGKAFLTKGEPMEAGEQEAVAAAKENPKYCPAGNCLCDHIRMRDKKQEANSKLCVASSFNAAEPQCVDKWEFCPVTKSQKYSHEPYEEAFSEWQRKLTPTTSVNMAAAIFKEVVSRYFVPRVQNHEV